MITLRSPRETQEQALRWKKEGAVALVPTMGALHEGHMQLVRRAKTLAPRVIVSVFVNPLQFGPNEDFHKYPRPFEADQKLCEQNGVDLLFAPSVEDLYPPGFNTQVTVGKLAQYLCGAYRPGHFDGVATVCLKLFQIAQPTISIFGEKDFQQVTILQRVTRDLNLPMAIHPEPTVRETDGVALSSRNRYLSTEERRWATRIPRALQIAKDWAGKEGARVGDVLDAATAELNASPLQIQYLTIASEDDLAPAGRDTRLSAIARPHLFVAAFAGTTRLIDNAALPGGTR